MSTCNILLRSRYQWSAPEHPQQDRAEVHARRSDAEAELAVAHDHVEPARHSVNRRGLPAQHARSSRESLGLARRLLVQAAAGGLGKECLKKLGVSIRGRPS